MYIFLDQYYNVKDVLIESNQRSFTILICFICFTNKKNCILTCVLLTFIVLPKYESYISTVLFWSVVILSENNNKLTTSNVQ